MVARLTPRITRSSRPSIEVSVETGTIFTHEAPLQGREGPRRVDTVVGLPVTLTDWLEGIETI